MQRALEVALPHVERWEEANRDPDGDALALVARGELAAATQRLMKRHGARIYRYCRSALRDVSLADDVHQQVFMEVLRDLPRFGGRSSVLSWVLAIAHHRVLDAAKARRRAGARHRPADTTAAIDLAPWPDELLDDARLRQVLAACVDELAPPIRAAVLLRYQQGLSFDEMAEICGEQAGTLQARVQRALPRLRARIVQWLDPVASGEARTEHD
jgi:RNA polymerase sigma-70 factor (ECF subfamily)